ncbi:ATP-binding protein, partial [Myxococcota bacterium]|nr:ATP-binding protein [Myxococcota bacterium]
MASHRIELTPEELNPLLGTVRQHIKEGNLPSLLTKTEKNPYGLGEKGNQVLRLLEEVGALFASFEILVDDFFEEEGFRSSRRQDPDTPKFSVLAAMSMACGYGARRLDELTNYTVRTVNAFDLLEIKEILRQDDVLGALITDLSRFVQKENPSHLEDLLKGLCGWFHLMVRTADDLALDPRYRREKKVCDSVYFTFLGFRFTPFSPPMDQGDQTTIHLPITMDKIIGNREYLQKGERLVNDLVAFDPTEGKNPKQFNQIIFGLGRPGCGKTASANALGNHLLKRAGEIGLDARFVVIRRTDWASSYQNASSKALIERFQSAVNDFKGVVLFYWPDIDTAFSSRGSSDLRSEEKGILGAAFGLFDGTILPFNGQWGLICDANYMQMD